MEQKKVIARDRRLSIGIDVDGQKSQIVVMDFVNGEVIYEGQITHDFIKWGHFLGRFENCQIWACYEAGGIGFWLCRFLRSQGIDCQVAAPGRVPYSAEDRKKKSDRGDAAAICRMSLDPKQRFVRIPTVEEEADRQLIRTREQLIKDRKCVRQRIRSFLSFHGVPKAKGIGKRWSRRYMNWLRTFKLENPSLRVSLDCLLNELDFVSSQIAILDGKILELSKSPKYAAKCERLVRQLSGVGILTAMTFLTEIFRPEEFPRAESLASHIGFTPSQYSSGGSYRPGHITHWGPPHLRRILTEAAWTWVRKDKSAGICHNRIRAGKEPKKAIVGMARRLCIIMWAMTVKNEDYNYNWAA